MLSPSLLSPLALVAGFSIAATDTAFSQTLTQTTVTVSADNGAPTEHGRPAAWRPFFVQGRADLEVTLNYDIILTNTAPVDIDVSANVLTGAPHVTNAFCWGSDASGSSSPYFVESTTVPSNGSIRLTGSTLLFDYPEGMFLSSCSPSQSDSIHVPDGVSRIFYGPSIGGNDWYLSYFVPGGGFPVSYASQASGMTTLLTVTTEHDLPLVAGSNGCEPLVANSTGATGQLEVYGAVDTTQSALVLQTSSLPAGVPGYFALSASTQPASQTSFGVSTLCLGAPVYRWIDSLGVTSSAGQYGTMLPVDLSAIPGGTIQTGSTWHLQFFHRDLNATTMAPTANSTNAVTLTF